jgi:small subunit ribosomal protein S21
MKEVRVLAKVQLRSNESQEALLRRFRKKVAKSGVLSTVRRKRWFVSKSELRRIQKKKAIRRHKRRGGPRSY